VPVSVNCKFEGNKPCHWSEVKGSLHYEYGINSHIHASNPGHAHYASLTANGTDLDPQYVRIESQRLAPNPAGKHAYCFSFWYYMFGTHAPWLEVRRMKLNNIWGNLTTDYTIWVQNTGMVDIWNEKSIDVVANQGDWKFAVDSLVEASSVGSVAFDDFKIVAGACNSNLANCDFELDLCGWKVDNDLPIKWIRTTALDNIDSPIGYDHTTGTEEGFYLEAKNSADTSIKENNLIAHLTSPIITNNANKQCVTFWFNIGALFDEPKPILRLIQNDYINGDQTTSHIVWSREGDQGTGWILGRSTVSVNDSLQ
ncbi:unnamed protein product, partial [Meganyctiphanes norvegica]